MTGIDPITFEVIRHRLWAINDEQATMAARLSGSPIVYESFDFNTGLLTASGEGLFTGIHLMTQATTMDVFVREILETWAPEDIREGDMFFTNDPWSGALHANDGILALPVFADGAIVTWAAIVMHDQDVGSPVPGSFVISATNRFDEAPLFPPIKLGENYELRPDLERAFLRNHRTPTLNAMNLRARVAALCSTERRIRELANEYGRDVVIACQEEIIDYVERVVRGRLTDIPDGTWYEQVYLDHDGSTNVLYPIRCAVTKAGDTLTVDFTGTAQQAPGPVNCARAALEGATCAIFLAFLCFDLPWAIGAAKRVMNIVAEPGTINNAVSPAAVSCASISATLTTAQAVSNAFAKMVMASHSDEHRAEAQACWSPGLNGVVLAGLDEHGEIFAMPMTEASGGGGGARAWQDGIDTGGSLLSGSMAIPNVETQESRLPILEVFRRECPDTGGAGRFRGGNGFEYALVPHRAPQPLDTITIAQCVSQPEGHGVCGGNPAAAQSNRVIRDSNIWQLFAESVAPANADAIAGTIDVLAAKSSGKLGHADVHVCLVTGGGGFGDPLRREPEAVLGDVRGGCVSTEAALTTYGVVTNGETVDEAATEAKRADLRKQRLAAGNRPAGWVPVTFEGPSIGVVGDTVELVELAGEVAYRCSVCNTVLARGEQDYKTTGCSLRELDPRELTVWNRFGVLPEIVVREFSCPGCGTAVAIDIQRSDEEPLIEMSLVANRGERDAR
jgi:N-methylhydantoinase B